MLVSERGLGGLGGLGVAVLRLWGDVSVAAAVATAASWAERVRSEEPVGESTASSTAIPEERERGRRRNLGSESIYTNRLSIAEIFTTS